MFKADLSDDVRHRNQHATPAQVENHVLLDIDERLSKHNKSVKDFNLPEPDKDNDIPDPFQKEVLEALDFDKDTLSQYVEENLPKLTEEQKVAFDYVVNWDGHGDPPVVFLDAPGGTGKTFLLKLLLAYIRLKGKIALPLASTGLASLLLTGGRTVHSTFKLPLLADPDMTCNISKRKTSRAELLKQVSLVVWDECAMQHRYVLESVERCMRDIRSDDKLFGGVPIVLGELQFTMLSFVYFFFFY